MIFKHVKCSVSRCLPATCSPSDAWPTTSCPMANIRLDVQWTERTTSNAAAIGGWSNKRHLDIVGTCERGALHVSCTRTYKQIVENVPLKRSRRPFGTERLAFVLC